MGVISIRDRSVALQNLGEVQQSIGRDLMDKYKAYEKIGTDIKEWNREVIKGVNDYNQQQSEEGKSKVIGKFTKEAGNAMNGAGSTGGMG